MAKTRSKLARNLQTMLDAGLAERVQLKSRAESAERARDHLQGMVDEQHQERGRKSALAADIDQALAQHINPLLTKARKMGLLVGFVPGVNQVGEAIVMATVSEVVHRH